MCTAKSLYEEAVKLVPLMQQTTDTTLSQKKKLVPKKPEPNIAMAAAGLGLYKNEFNNPQRAIGEMNKAYPQAIASHNGVKLVKEWKDRFARYYELNPPEEMGLKRKLSVENLVLSAGAALQSIRASMSPEKPVAEDAEKATPANTTPEEMPAKETPAKEMPKESAKAETPPAKANGSTETAVVPEPRANKSIFDSMMCCTARPGRAAPAASASA